MCLDEQLQEHSKNVLYLLLADPLPLKISPKLLSKCKVIAADQDRTEKKMIKSMLVLQRSNKPTNCRNIILTALLQVHWLSAVKKCCNDPFSLYPCLIKMNTEKTPCLNSSGSWSLSLLLLPTKCTNSLPPFQQEITEWFG